MVAPWPARCGHGGLAPVQKLQKNKGRTAGAGGEEKGAAALREREERARVWRGRGLEEGKEEGSGVEQVKEGELVLLLTFGVSTVTMASRAGGKGKRPGGHGLAVGGKACLPRSFFFVEE